MSTTSAAIKLAIFAVVTTVATGLLGMSIGNIRFFETTTYRAIFANASGLVSGQEVRIAGVRVGQVTDVEVVNTDQAEVTFTVLDSRPLSVSTEASIRYLNLVGQRYLELSQAPGSGERLDPGGVIPVNQTEPALDLTVLFNGFKPLFRALSPKQVNTLSREIIAVLQGQAGTVTSLLSHTASLTNTLANRDQVIGQLITNLNEVLATLDQRDQRLSQLIVELQTFVSGLSDDRKVIGESLEQINALSDSTAGLLDDARPLIKADVHEIRGLSENILDNEKFIEDYIQGLPKKVNEINRTGSYGGWFNFYLCNFDAKVALPGGSKQWTPEFHNETARCQR